MKYLKLLFAVVCAVFLLNGEKPEQILAQDKNSPALDTFIIIDNSCSMFPTNAPGCASSEVSDNDPNFLRIIGADLFLAKLGLGEPNEEEYQAGVISLGLEPKLVSPLQPLSLVRDSLARAINDPTPELATGIVPAIEMAYDQLRNSPDRRPANTPVVILITDGIPYPQSGQSNADIEALLSRNPDIPVFVMLLQNPTNPTQEYAHYIRFWQQLQSRHAHIFAYEVEDDSQIEDAYNSIASQLGGGPPGTEGVEIFPDQPLQVFVDRYVSKIEITIRHEVGQPKGQVSIQDPNGIEILNTDDGVTQFRGEYNPVEVYTIIAPRLTNDLKDRFWTVSSDRPVKVFLDHGGAYRVNFLTPSVILTDIRDVYLATETVSPSGGLSLRFVLTDNDAGHAITDVQPIYGKVIFPDGQETIWRIPAEIQPDENGVYTVNFDLAYEFPAIFDKPGQPFRFTFILNAGSADDQSEALIPIATSRLLLDVWYGPGIGDLNPLPPLVCNGQQIGLTVTVDNYELADPSAIELRVLGGGKDVLLENNGDGTFSGKIGALCDALLSSVTCSSVQGNSFELHLATNLADGSFLPALDQSIPINVIAPVCTPPPTLTPTSTPTSTPTPTPTPTPVPDTDRDGFKDPQDRCPGNPGIEQFNGCPTPWWVWLIVGLIGLGILIFIIKWGIPFLTVNYFSPPPQAYILICIPGEKNTPVISIYQRGKSKLSNKVTIGGDKKKDHIHVPGLESNAYRIEKQSDKVVLVEGKSDRIKSTITDSPPSPIHLADGITLKASLDQTKLGKC